MAVLVLLLFLKDLRTTLIIGISIPISVVATFFLMYRTGTTLNIMSLGGLALGVGHAGGQQPSLCWRPSSSDARQAKYRLPWRHREARCLRGGPRGHRLHPDHHRRLSSPWSSWRASPRSCSSRPWPVTVSFSLHRLAGGVADADPHDGRHFSGASAVRRHTPSQQYIPAPPPVGFAAGADDPCCSSPCLLSLILRPAVRFAAALGHQAHRLLLARPHVPAVFDRVMVGAVAAAYPSVLGFRVPSGPSAWWCWRWLSARRCWPRSLALVPKPGPQPHPRSSPRASSASWWSCPKARRWRPPTASWPTSQSGAGSTRTRIASYSFSSIAGGSRPVAHQQPAPRARTAPACRCA